MSGNSGILRRFNDTGIAEFVRRIETLRAGGTAEIDDAFVTDVRLTEALVPEVLMERPAFLTKRDAGAYLSKRTHSARMLLGDDDRGLWTWLSAWHWGAICPIAPDGRRKVLAPYCYVFGQTFAQRRKQHILAVAVQMYELCPSSRLILDTPVTRLTKVVECVSTRLFFQRISGLLPLLDLMYYDPHRNAAKPGITDARVTKPGDLVNRLPARIRQLEVTHDLTNLTAEQLLNLLGDEFRQWAVVPADATPPRRKSPRAVTPPAVPPAIS